jgi:hypothetical protein
VLVLALTGQNFIADDEQTKCHAGLSSRSCTSMRSQHSGVLPIALLLRIRQLLHALPYLGHPCPRLAPAAFGRPAHQKQRRP